MTLISVSDSASLLTALSSAKAGDTISLASGDYGDVTISRLKFASDVTITSSDADNPAVFHSLNLSSVSHIALNDIAINLQPSANSVDTATALRIANSSSISLTHSNLVGGLAVNGVSPDTPAGQLDSTGNVLGLPTGRGIVVNFSSDINLSDNTITEFHKGITLGTVDGIQIVGNSLTELRATPIGGGNLNNVVISNNYASDLTPWQLGGSGDHMDFIHIWTSTTQTQPSSNFEISGNTFLQGDGTALPVGIYFDDNTNAMGFTNVSITENVLYNSNHQAIRLENVADADVGHNTLLNGPGGNATDAPLVLLATGATANVHDNILGTARNDGSVQPDASGNVYLQAFDSAAANYVGNFIFNATDATSQTAELQLMPGTALSGLGVGAASSQFDAQSDLLTAHIVTSASDASKGLVSFDAATSNDHYGYAAAQGAKFTWDFGDGSTASGVNAAHQFKEPGDYSVALTVTLDGVSDTSTTLVHVADPVLIDLVFDTSAAASAGTSDSLKLAAAGAYSLASLDQSANSTIPGTSDGLHLAADGAYSLSKQDSAQLSNLAKMDVDFDIRRDSPTGATGYIAQVHGSWYVSLTSNGEISFNYEDANGQKFTVTSKGANITDTLDHQVNLQFDSTTHSLEILVDGHEVANGVIGGRLQGMESWGLAVGNPYGTSPAVTVGHLMITDGSLDSATAPIILPSPPVDTTPIDTAPVDTAPVVSTPTPTPTESLLALDFSNLDGTTGQNGYHLTNSTAYSVAKADISNLFGLDKMEIDFDIARASATGATGYLMRVHGSWYVSLTKAGEISFTYTDDAGKAYTVTTSGAGIVDAKDHNVSLQFDSTQHQMHIYVDGKQVADAAIGGALQGAESWGLSVGNPYGAVADATIGHLTIGDSLQGVSAAPAGSLLTTTPVVEPKVLYTHDFSDLGSTAGHIGYHLTDNTAYSVAKTDISNLFGLDKMEIDFDIARDSATGDTGYLMRVHGSWYVSLTKTGEISFAYTDADNNPYTVTSHGAGIVDTKDHNVSLQFDSTQHQMHILVDGRDVADATIGGHLQGMESWGLSVGDPYGAVADATIGHLTITDGAAAQAAASTPTPPTTTAPAVGNEILYSHDFSNLGSTDGHIGYHLTDNTAYSVAKTDISGIFGLDKMEVDFDIARDSATADTGYLMRVHGSWYVSLTKSGEIAFNYTDADGKAYSVTSHGAGIVDTKDHNVSLQFDSTQHDMHILVDGKQVADATIGGHLQAMESWGFSVGNPYGAVAHATIGHLAITDVHTWA